MTVETIGLGGYGLALGTDGPAAKPGGIADGSMMAGFQLNTDIAPLFPYINAVAQRAQLFQNPPFIRFVFEEHLCGLHPQNGVASPFYNSGEAALFVERLLAFLNDIRLRLDEIVPKYKTFRRASVVDIIKLLPRNNCRECGFASCMAFAASVSQQEARPEWCPHLGTPLAEQVVYPVFDDCGRVSSTVTIDVDSVGNQKPPASTPETPEPGKTPATSGTGQTDEPATGQSAPVDLPEALTPREMEVLRMVARGATNREISGRLKISPHTVKSHVTHIFNKLGVNDRTKAAVWATRHGLV